MLVYGLNEKPINLGNVIHNSIAIFANSNPILKYMSTILQDNNIYVFNLLHVTIGSSTIKESPINQFILLGALGFELLCTEWAYKWLSAIVYSCIHRLTLGHERSASDKKLYESFKGITRAPRWLDIHLTNNKTKSIFHKHLYDLEIGQYLSRLAKQMSLPLKAFYLWHDTHV